MLLAVETIRDRKIRIVTFDNTAGRSATPGFDVVLKKENGMNSQFEVVSPRGYLVLAIKRPIRSRNGGSTDAIYSPYSEELDVPAVRQQGLDYLRRVLNSAKYELEARRVYSAVIPGEFVAKIVPTRVAEVLVIIEHIDPGRFMYHGVSIDTLVSEVLTVIGLNRENAYKYAVSPAGARGLFQFMPMTYVSICKGYPRAALTDNFVSGMNNHVNAAMASFLLFDYDLSCFDTSKRASLLSDARALGLYLASAYNTGATRTVKSMKKHGDRWIGGLLPETRVYLEKYNSVSGMMR